MSCTKGKGGRRERERREGREGKKERGELTFSVQAGVSPPGIFGASPEVLQFTFDRSALHLTAQLEIESHLSE